MTGKQIYDQILLLGARESVDFEFEKTDVFEAINRAIDEVNKLFPAERGIQILNYPISPCEVYKGITVHKGGEDKVFDASDVKSLAFAVSGTGSALLACESSGAFKEYSWIDETKLKTFKSIVAEDLPDYNGGKVSLTFTGEYTYLIKDVTFYDELASDLAEDVDTYSPWRAYDLSAENYAGGNFLDFASQPIRFNNVSLNSPRDFKIEGSVIYLPADKPGVYELSYYKRPTHVDADNDHIELDIDIRLHPLVALRAAYYIYQLVDEEAAANANNEYQRVMSLTVSTMPKLRTPKQLRDLRGW